MPELRERSIPVVAKGQSGDLHLEGGSPVIHTPAPIRNRIRNAPLRIARNQHVVRAVAHALSMGALTRTRVNGSQTPFRSQTLKTHHGEEGVG